MSECDPEAMPLVTTAPTPLSSPKPNASKDAALWRPYCQMATAAPAVPVVRTKGSSLYLADGRELTDGIASWWTACHGYNHPVLLDALCSQAQEMPHVMLGGITHPQASRLATRLAHLFPGTLNHVFFSDSGSVSVEIALKIAKQYWRNLGKPHKTRMACLENGYHGDTLGAMSVTSLHQGKITSAEVLPGLFLPVPSENSDWAALEEMLAKEQNTLAALIVEPLVQGAAGMQMHTAPSLHRLCTLARQYELLVIFDEIFTGFGRTGTLFAYEQVDFVPDLLCVSKALTGGVISLAATIASEAVFEAFLGDSLESALWHGPTFMGNPLACAVANANLDLFEQGHWKAQVHNIEQHLEKTLRPLENHPLVNAVRVLGAIGVLELKSPATAQLQAFCIEQGVWLRPFGQCFYTTPCFPISFSALNHITQTMGAALDYL